MFTAKRHLSTWVVVLAVWGLWGAYPGTAETIGYWRFEEGTIGGSISNSTDYGPNGYDLTAVNTNNLDYVSSLIPVVPLTGQTNNIAMNFKSNGRYVRSTPAADFYQNTAFTIEGWFNNADGPGGNDDTGVLVSQWNTGQNSTEWEWRIRLDSETPYFHLGEDDIGDGSSIVERSVSFDTFLSSLSTPTIDDKDLFVAAVFEDDPTSSGNATITWYGREHLGGGTQGPWITETDVIPDFNVLYDASVDFLLSEARNAAAAARFEGRMDEWRYSSVALTQEELLAAPEPTTAFLGALAAAALLAMRPSRKKAIC